uniref:putative ubiquitin-conjugating enzyme E2Q2-like protein isoform X6 n=1 Tax=Macaca mulatta TaxID=9544 RepID=UPI0010A21740|nr:putative ubiquitin-conjugating enzyme E2Q2-like protein isoform X6 [Macaca mulatta]
MRFVFKEKLTMKMDSLREEKLECSLWCCLSDPSPQGQAGPCCLLERRIVPWMQQESYSSSSPIWFVDSDEPNLTSVLECLEDTKNNNLLHQQLKSVICGLCRLYNLPKHRDVEMPDQPLPMGQVCRLGVSSCGLPLCLASHALRPLHVASLSPRRQSVLILASRSTEVELPGVLKA